MLFRNIFHLLLLLSYHTQLHVKNQNLNRGDLISKSVLWLHAVLSFAPPSTSEASFPLPLARVTFPAHLLSRKELQK